MFNSILVVCTGNICRSRWGSGCYVSNCRKQVTSAGIFGLEGHPADAVAQDVAWHHGVSLDDHVGAS
jgi:protein-tyrosine phosphatase